MAAVGFRTADERLSIHIPEFAQSSIDARLEVEGLARSYSTRTIYQVLVKNQRIAQRKPREPEPMERPEPMSHWQIDYRSLNGVWWQMRRHHAKLKTGRRQHRRAKPEQQEQFKKTSVPR